MVYNSKSFFTYFWQEIGIAALALFFTFSNSAFADDYNSEYDIYDRYYKFYENNRATNNLVNYDAIKEEVKPTPSSVAKGENDKIFSFGLRLGYAKSQFAFDTPDTHSILNWGNMNAVSGGIDLGIKITDNIDVALEYSYSKLKGVGSDDDMQNGLGYYSKQKARGHVNDLSIVTNFDLFKSNQLKISPRLGYFFKRARLGMYDALADNNSEPSTFHYDSSLSQQTRSTYQGAKVGLKFEDSFSANTKEAFIFDYYPLVQYHGRQFWPHGYQKWNLESSNDSASLGRNYGFMARFEHNFRASESSNIWMKIYSFYELISVNDIIYKGNNTYSAELGNAASKGYANWRSYGVGIGVYY